MISFCDSNFFSHLIDKRNECSISRTKFYIEKHSNFLRPHKNQINTNDGKI